MIPGVERLMPWRTIVEMTKNIPLISQHNVAICSGQHIANESRVYDGVTIHQIEHGIDQLIQFVNNGTWDVVFYPISYRLGIRNLSSLKEINAHMIAYIPGGLYSFDGVRALWKVSGVKTILPYLLELITPHKWLTSKLKKLGFAGCISQSQLTTIDAIKSGWNETNALTALPGLDDFIDITPDYTTLESLNINRKDILLFTGAPAQIRGSQYAIKAFDKIAHKTPNATLLMLMRRDVSSDFKKFEKTVSEIKHKDQIIICYDKLTPAQLKAFFIKSYAVLLPFLLVPSEIPLTFFEVMSCSTPIITFKNNGTTDYLKDGLIVVNKRSTQHLANAILELCNNQQKRNELAENSKKIITKHPSWKESAKIWVHAIDNLNA